MKLSIIIVSFNTRDVLSHCLESLYTGYKQQFINKQFEVILIDNASSDDTIVMIKKAFPWVTLIQSESNSGFAKANNWGIQKSHGEYVLLLNPDTIVEKNTLTYLITYMDGHQAVGISTCKVLLTNGQLDDACHRGFPTPWRAFTYFSGLAKLFPHSTFFNGYHLGYQHMDEIHEIESCVGAFLLIRRTIGERVHWLDEDYFWYGEDLDLCYRVKQLGSKIMYIPDVSIIHYKGAASGLKKHSQHITKADSGVKLRATEARFAVMRTFYEKHYRTLYPRWMMRLVFLGIGIKEKVARTQL